MSEHEPDLTPEQETRLRRLLADARLDEPMPEDVAARLDRVLEQLRDQDPAPAEPDEEAVEPASPLAAVIDLGGRRRRLAAGLLVAAAAVVVAGVAVGHLRSDSSGDTSAATTRELSSQPAAVAGSTASDLPSAATPDDLRASGDTSAEQDSGGVGGTFGSTDSSGPAGAPVPSPSSPVRPLPALRHATFARQVRRLQGPARLHSKDAYSVSGLGEARTPRCTGRFGAGRRVAVTYDGLDAVLVFRRPSADAQVVDLFRCGSSEILRTTTLPAR